MNFLGEKKPAQLEQNEKVCLQILALDRQANLECLCANDCWQFIFDIKLRYVLYFDEQLYIW